MRLPISIAIWVLLLSALSGADAGLFQALDLAYPGMESVSNAVARGDCSSAERELCSYFRQRAGTFWWKEFYRPVSVEAGERGLRTWRQLRDRRGYFSSEHWNPDGSYNWDNGPDAKMSHRMYFFSGLANAYAYSGNEQIARAWIELSRDWINQMPQEDGHYTWASMTVGIRLRTGWGDSFVRFVHSPSFDDQSMILFLESFYEQACFLREHPSETSNWLTFEMAGLYSAGVLFPEFKAAADWRSCAEETALADLDKGWLPDGMSIELTPGYGQFFSNYLKMHDLAREVGYETETSKKLVARCERLFDPFVRIMAPDRMTPAFNDNKPVNVPEFLKEAVARFPGRADFEWIVSKGRKGAPPETTSMAFPYAGYLVIRSGWQTNANYLCFDAGPLGYRHAHQDKLGLVLWAYGRQILFDPGREAYADTPHQQYCMDTFSHSTGLVDNRPQRRQWYKNPSPRNLPYRKAENFVYETEGSTVWGRGSYNGDYGRQGSVGTDSYPYKEGGNFNEDWCRPASHERQVAYLAPDIFVVQDRFVPNDSARHAYEIRWQLDSLKLSRQGTFVATGDSGQPNLAVIPLDLQGLEPEMASAQDQPEILGWKVKGKSHPATTLRHLRSGKGEQRFLTLLLPLEPGESAVGISGKREADGTFSLTLKDGRRLKVLPGERLVLSLQKAVNRK